MLLRNFLLLSSLIGHGGVIYGVLEGLIIVYGALAIIQVITPMMKNEFLHGEIEKSHLCKMMYENNIILNIIL